MAARRRTILVFHDRGGDKGVERLALGGGSSGGLYQVYRDPDSGGRELWGPGPVGRCCASWSTSASRARSRVDVSQTHAFSGRPAAWASGSSSRPRSAPGLAAWCARKDLPLDYIDTRAAGDAADLPPDDGIVARADRRARSRARSSRRARPRRRTWCGGCGSRRQRHGPGRVVPAVRSASSGAGRRRAASAPRRRRTAPVIQRGDHLHTDFGIYAMGLATDTQHVGYVLKAGETDAPAGLRARARQLEPAAGHR